MRQWKPRKSAARNASAPAVAREAPVTRSANATADVDASVRAANRSAKALTIGRVAELAGVGVETVRFYEREGLISQPPRPSDGYRVYPIETVRRIQFLRHCQELGFALKEARELAGLTDSSCACGQVTAKIDQLDAKIAALHRLRDELSGMLGKRPSGMCGVMETLQSHTR